LPSLTESGVLSSADRDELLARYHATRSGRERAGRYWKVNLDELEFPEEVAAGGHVTLPSIPHRNAIATTLEIAAVDHAALFARAFGQTGVQNGKFGALAAANAQVGAFIYIPADADIVEPILVTYNATGSVFYPYTVVLAEAGARATIIERVEAAAGSFVCGAVEVVTGERADVSYTSVQSVPNDARYIMTRSALPGRDARIAWAIADLGGELSVGSADAEITKECARVEIAALFFPRGSEHVDLVTSVYHRVGHAVSETIVKSAATESGQARYLGNILISRDAQGSNASLRDDALLLSPQAHIDSIPALEIAANDVKAFHGATVGAIDDEQIFYMISRGIEPTQAERMIALGFFEPALDRFPTDALRDEIRTILQAKVV